jgi:RNA polymerase sigma factor (TIGR02999 family)
LVWRTPVIPEVANSPEEVPMNDVTRILSAIEQGEPRAAEQLLPLVYDELRRVATAKIAREKPGQTLQATALVHEAYLRLVNGVQAQHWNSRRHFFAAAAEAMWRILVEQARRKQTERRGGQLRRRSLDELDLVYDEPHGDLLALDEALNRLAAEHPDKAELVKLRYFAGLSIDDTAHALGISPATVKRHWEFARVWLFREVSDAGRPSP